MIKPTLIFATNNQHKVEEIRSIIGDEIMVISLKEAGIDIDIPEPYFTLEANASEKSRTVISLIWNDKEFLFEGVSEGKIIHEQRGERGFGYDPVFVPDESENTFAEMTLDEKNKYSHRRKAIDKLISFLKARIS